jgi:hypothetical protein
MRAQGRVVLPVFARADHVGGMAHEILPPAALIDGARTLAQVDVPAGPDGITRGVYLQAGPGSPYWPALALALDRLASVEHGTPLPGLRNPSPGDASPYRWIRDHYALVRFAGGAGSFDLVPGADVIDGRVPVALLRVAGYWWPPMACILTLATLWVLHGLALRWCLAEADEREVA